MAKVLRTDGTSKIVHPANREEGFTLEELRSLVGCRTLSTVPIWEHERGNGTVLVDDEALMKEVLPAVNQQATDLIREIGFMCNDVVIVGDALVCWDEDQELK